MTYQYRDGQHQVQVHNPHQPNVTMYGANGGVASNYNNQQYYDEAQAAEVAYRVFRDGKRSHRPTRYIVNNGEMHVDDKSLKRSNTIIYNSAGSVLYLKPRSGDHHHHHRSSSASSGYLLPDAPVSVYSTHASPVVHHTGYGRQNHYHHTTPYMSSLPSTSLYPSCRGCYERRELYLGGLCRDCHVDIDIAKARSNNDRRAMREVRESRLLGWR